MFPLFINERVSFKDNRGSQVVKAFYENVRREILKKTSIQCEKRLFCNQGTQFGCIYKKKDSSIKRCKLIQIEYVS